MPKKSIEIYLGQRGREKRELFKQFRIRAIENLYKGKFFALFNNRCFKCGAKERPHQEIGQPPILCIDHHIPMALGGHLTPGNLVALCRSCNNEKLDLPPEIFYSLEELERLKPILAQEAEVFSFSFNWNAWNEDRESYLLSLGIPPTLVKELLHNPEHPDFVGVASENPGITFAVDLSEIHKSDEQ